MQACDFQDRAVERCLVGHHEVGLVLPVQLEPHRAAAFGSLRYRYRWPAGCGTERHGEPRAHGAELGADH